MDSEKAHQRSLNFLSGFGQNPAGQKVISSVYHAPELPIHVFGKLFHHPLGLAAGFDKKAQALTAWPALGFSWMEYGGITRYPQDGNPKPRMFRADSEQALVNRMGFNNPGALAIRDSLNQRKARGKWPNTPVVANIGRSKKVTNDNVMEFDAGKLHAFSHLGTRTLYKGKIGNAKGIIPEKPYFQFSDRNNQHYANEISEFENQPRKVVPHQIWSQLVVYFRILENVNYFNLV